MGRCGVDHKTMETLNKKRKTMKWYAICDCDNCYVSCERVFRPDLEGKPIVVLSNNDVCIIDSEEQRLKAAKLYPIGEIWGIGRRYQARIEAMGIRTVHDFASHSASWVYSMG